MLEENVTGHGVNQITACRRSYFIAIVLNTCPNSLRVAVRSTAICRGSFDRNIICLSTLKAIQPTVGMAGVAGEGVNVSSQWPNLHTVIKRR